jgi:catechol-2,3-dioxygenase
MPSRLTDVIVDCHDLERVTGFWCAALGYERVTGGDGWVAIGFPGQELTVADLRAAPQPPLMAFVVVPEAKAVKNRVHLDITPVDASQASEVERLLALGATRADVGQGEETWVVMADPEGNEFDVLRPLTAEELADG